MFSVIYCFYFYFQEIAAILISFDKHSEWQSKEVKTRLVMLNKTSPHGPKYELIIAKIYS
jgi:hypothetical protein